MNEIKIEKGVPVYKSRYSNGLKYPFDDMVSGDSFEFECNREDVNLNRNRLIVNAKSRGKKVITRRTEKGIRVWVV